MTKRGIRMLLPVFLLSLLSGCGNAGNTSLTSSTAWTEAEQTESETEERKTDEEGDGIHGYYDLTGKTNEEFVNGCLGDGAYDKEPYASYTNPEGRLQMEVYHDDASSLWCGIRYAVKEDERTYGFLIDENEHADEVGGSDIYGEPMDELISAEEWIAGFSAAKVENPEAEYLYDDEARICVYEVTGDITNYEQEVMDSEFLYKIKYDYYENGMTKKTYNHNTDYFGIVMHYYEKVYDENERQLYSYSATPLGVEGYFLYDEASDIPKYQILLDEGNGRELYEPRLLVYMRPEDISARK